MTRVIRLLSGGDRRSIGRVAEVVDLVEQNPSFFHQVIEAFEVDDEVVRMRASDALEKLTRNHPEWIAPYAEAVWNAVGSDLKEVRWHVAQMLPRVAQTPASKRRAMDVLTAYISDPSSIVRTCAMQSLADLSVDDANLRRNVVQVIHDLVESGTPAMKSRGRKLLKRLE
jgi:hypothetical protein